MEHNDLRTSERRDRFFERSPRMLSSQTQKIHRERLRQLEQLGFAMPFEYHLFGSQPSEVFVEQCGSGIESPVCYLSDSRTLYTVWLSLVAERPGVCLCDYRLVPPWPDRGFQRLPSFADSHIGEAYVLPGKWEYPREDVLNLRFGKTGWRLPCTRMEGVLAALSDTPIPEEYSHGSPIPVGVEFFSKSGRQVAETRVTLWTDRLTHHPRTLKHAEEGQTAKPLVAPAAAARPSAIARPRRYSLYGPSGGYVVRAADQRVEEGSPPAARARGGGPRIGLL
jgi:hypothetical protein